MTFRAWALAGTASIMALSGSVLAKAQVPDPQASESQPTTGPASVFVSPVNPVPPLDDRAREALRRAVKNDQRIDAQRDRWRNPEATLQFFGVRPSDTVVEIWPGQGWYTSILGPYLKQGDGKLIVGHFDAVASNSQVVRQMVDAYRARFASDPALYGNVSVVPFGPRSMPMAPANSVDKVLTFRNIHNWMAQGWTEKAFADFYTVLKPGGILGIEEHRGRTDEPQDPLARDGYVREDYVIQLAREAGFEFIGGAEINANPADTKDHPFGVWTLPPVSRTSPIGQIDDPGFDRRRYDEIGESDRMTLRFRKPLDATGVGLASSRPTADQIPVTIIPSPPPPPRRGRRGAPPPPPTPPVVADVESKPDVAGAAAGVAPKEAAVAPTASLRTKTDDPQAEAPPRGPTNARRGSTAKDRTPSPTSAPVAPAGAAVPSDAAAAKPTRDGVPPRATPDTARKVATEPVGTATPTTLRPRQRGAAPATPKAAEPTDVASALTSKPKADRPGARDGEATAAASPSARSRTGSGTASAPAEEANAKSAKPASRAKAGEEVPAAPNRRTSRSPAAEPVQTKASASKSKSTTKASSTDATRPASSRNRNRPETKATPKAAPTKKSPSSAKPNPNKPDWIVPPKKKKN